jgi:hypothetical protein
MARRGFKYLFLSDFLHIELKRRAKARGITMNDWIAEALGLTPKSHRRRYYFSNIKVGETILVPWNGPRKTRQPAIWHAIKTQEQRFGKKFTKETNSVGVLLTRVK